MSQQSRTSSLAKMSASRTPTSQRQVKTYEDWLNDIKDFLRQKLSLFIPSDYVEKFIDPDAMKTWQNVFTHISLSPENYERLETVGDSIIKSAFYDYVHQALPWVNRSSTYSELEKYYNSKDFFAKVSENEGLPRFLRKSPLVPNNIKSIKEDLFEAFNGALFEIGNRIGLETDIHLPIGYNVVKNYITLIFNNVEIDAERAFGSFQSQLKEISQKLSLKVEDIIQPFGENVIAYYYIKRFALVKVLESLGEIEEVERFQNFQSDYKKYLRNKEQPINQLDIENYEAMKKALEGAHILEDPFSLILLGQGISTTKEEAQSLGSRASLGFFRRLGITREIASNYADENASPEFAELTKEIRKFYPSFRIENVEYDEVKKTLRMLVGTPAKGKPRTLAVVLSPTKKPFREVKLELLQKAVEKIERS